MRFAPISLLFVCGFLFACASATDLPLPPPNDNTAALLRETTPADSITRICESPGSYEWWNFYAESFARDISLSAIFMPANLFDSHYRNAVRAWRVDPESAPPPAPSDHWLLQINVAVDGQKVFSNVRRWPDGDTDFPRDEPRGRIGDSSFVLREEEGRHVFHVSIDAPDMTNYARLIAHLTFRAAAPGFAVAGEGLYHGLVGGADHDWQFPIGLPRTEGSFRVEQRDGTVLLPETAIEGDGYVDHMWGSGLLCDILDSWYFGTTPLGDGERLVHVWLQPAEDAGEPYGYAFWLRPEHAARTFELTSFEPSAPREGEMGLLFHGDTRFGLEDDGFLRVRFGDDLGEDWHFQVAGPSLVDVEVPGELSRRGLAGVAEYLRQDAIDHEEYQALFAIIDEMPWED